MASHKLIIGVGNDILSDDAIGPKLVKNLEENYPGNGWHFLTAALGGMEIVELLNGYSQAIIIDAIRTKNGVPGTVYHLIPEDFKETLHLSSFHDMNFLVALEFAKKMDLMLPRKINIIAIEIVEDLLFSNNLSPILSKKYDQIYLEVSNLVTRLLKI